MYILRLDDACEYMNTENWEKILKLCSKYNIKPLVGIVPNVKDIEIKKLQYNDNFWDDIKSIKNKCDFALHGYDHVYITENGGLNPVQNRSEFAGICLEEQENKIRKGIEVFRKYDINPIAFFAPSHTFDLNTIKALKSESDIKWISDTIATNIYKYEGIYFIPQQSGNCRRLPFKIVTFCYHPNVMKEKDFEKLESFLLKYGEKFTAVSEIKLIDRKRNIFDLCIQKLYFILLILRRRMKK